MIPDSTLKTKNSELLSEHPHPRPGLRRVQTWLTGLGLLVIGLATISGLVLAAAGLSLMLFIAIFTIALSAPLWLVTVAHPPITATERGLILYPMFWRRRLVHWPAIRAIERHTLLPNDEPGRRLLVGRRNYTPPEGRLIVVDGTLPVQFRLMGLLSGQGFVPTFGISNAAHVDYDQLLSLIKSRTRLKRKHSSE